MTVSLCLLCQGDSQRVEMPRREIEVVKGQMVVLQAWYSPTSDIGRNSVIWNFMANDSKQVCKGSPLPQTSCMVSTETTVAGSFLMNFSLRCCVPLIGDLLVCGLKEQTSVEETVYELLKKLVDYFRAGSSSAQVSVSFSLFSEVPDQPPILSNPILFL